MNLTIINKIVFLLLLCTASTKLYSSSKRTVVPLTTINLHQLITNISKETTAFFYLVDKVGMPISQQNAHNAMGSKSLKLPAPTSLNESQKAILASISVAVSENAQTWIQKYVNQIKSFRSKNLSGTGLATFNTQWNAIAPWYSSSLLKIFHTITLNSADAQKLNFMSNNQPILWLFFDDPCPAHTIVGTAQRRAQDKLADFIKRYN